MEYMLVLAAADGSNWGLYQWDTDTNTFTLAHSLPHGAVSGAVHGFSDGSIICVGDAYDAYYHEGSWSHEHVTDKSVSSSHRTGTDYHTGPVWLFRGAVWFRWNGATWDSGALPVSCVAGSSGNHNGMAWGASASEAWVRCLGNTLYRTTNGGANWSDYSAQVLTDTGQSLNLVAGGDDIWGFSANEVYFGDGGCTRVIKWNGSNFSTHMTDYRLQYGVGLWGVASDKLIITGVSNWGVTTWVNGVLKDTGPVLSYWRCRLRGTSDGSKIINLLGNGRARLSRDGGATWEATPASWPIGVGIVPDVTAAYEWVFEPNWSYELAGDESGNALNWDTQPSTGSSGLDLTGGAVDECLYGSGATYEGFDAGWGNAGYLWAFSPANLSDAMTAPESFDWYIQSRFEFDEDDLALGLTEQFEWGLHVDELDAVSATPESFESGWGTTRENNMTSSETAYFTGVVAYEACDTWTAVMV